MDELLNDFLKAQVGPDVAELLTESCELLDQFDYDRHVLPITDAIMNAGNEMPETTVDTVRVLIVNGLIDVLKMHAIYVMSDMPIPLLNRFCHFIKMLETTEENGYILDICRSDMNDQEKIAEIAGVVTGIAAEEYLVYIDETSPLLIDSIMKIVNQDDDVSETEDIEKIRQKVEKVELIYQGDQRHYVLDLLNEGLALNLRLVSYIKLTDIFNITLTVKEVAKALIAFTVLSCDAVSNPLPQLTSIVTAEVSDEITAAKLISELHDLFILINQSKPLVIGVSDPNGH